MRRREADGTKREHGREQERGAERTIFAFPDADEGEDERRDIGVAASSDQSQAEDVPKKKITQRSSNPQLTRMIRGWRKEKNVTPVVPP